MIIDKQTLMSDSQAIIADAVSTNVIDLGADDAAIQAFVEKGMTELFVQVEEDFTLLTSLTIDLQTDSDVAFGSATTLLSQTIALADLVAGKQFAFGKLPAGCERYIRMNYNVTGTDPDAGILTAALILDRQTNGIL